MIRALQAGFGEPIAETLPGLLAIGVQGARLDCLGLDAAQTLVLVNEVLSAGMIPLAIVDTPAQLALLPRGVNVEFHNEPDLARRGGRSQRGVVEPNEYRVGVDAMWEACQRYGLYLWAGSISNLIAHKRGRGLQWLDATSPHTWPAGVNVSVHRYPDGDFATNPHVGFADRFAEVDALTGIIGARHIACTEFGYHQADKRANWERWLRLPKRAWSEDEVRDCVRHEWSFWENVGALGAVLYQHNDGPTSGTSAPHALDTYGIRRADGSLKPVASTFRWGR